MTDTTTTAPAVDTYADLIVAMRKPDVTGLNAATTWGRATLKLMVAVNDKGLHEFDIEMATRAVCEVYKPKTNKGKPAYTQGALKGAGFAGMADRLRSVNYIFEKRGIDGVFPLVEAFLASTKASDTLNKLETEVKEAVKAAAKALVPAESESEGEGEGEGEGDNAKPVTFADLVASMAETIANATATDCANASQQLADLSAAIALLTAKMDETDQQAVNG